MSRQGINSERSRANENSRERCNFSRNYRHTRAESTGGNVSSKDRGRIPRRQSRLCFKLFFMRKRSVDEHELQQPSSAAIIYSNGTAAIYIKSHGRMIPIFQESASIMLPTGIRTQPGLHSTSHKMELHGHPYELISMFLLSHDDPILGAVPRVILLSSSTLPPSCVIGTTFPLCVVSIAMGKRRWAGMGGKTSICKLHAFHLRVFLFSLLHANSSSKGRIKFSGRQY